MIFKNFLEIPVVYDLIQFIFGKPEVDKSLIQEIERMGIYPGSRILDLGGGTGLNRLLFKNEQHYFCLDLDYRKIKKSLARDKMNHSILADATEIPIMKDTIDLVLLTSVTHHLPDRMLPLLFSEIRRVLAPNGYLLLLDPVFVKKNLFGSFFLKFDLGSFPRTKEDLLGHANQFFYPCLIKDKRIIHSYLIYSGRAIHSSDHEVDASKL